MVLINLDDSEITDEYILYSHNYMKNKIQIALNKIKEYIITNNLLIVGGTAIDYALKLQNTTLYNDLYQVPDFDIISPNNIQHANNIAEILCNMKYTDISIVPAIHHTTVRVQLLGFTLFDSTYIPEYIYNKLPYLEYKEFKIIHPTYQKINQYLSLSLLYKITGPSYNLVNRFIKDVKRLDLLNNYYIISNNESISSFSLSQFSFNYKFPLIYNIKINDNDKEYNFKSIENTQQQFFNKYHINDNISFSFETNFIFHGTLAYNLLYGEFIRIYSKLYSILPLTKDDQDYIKYHYSNITIHQNYNIQNDQIIFDIYQPMDITFINTNGNKSKYNINYLLNHLQSKYSKVNYTIKDNIIDLRPKYINGSLYDNDIIFDFKIFDLYGDLLGINLIYNHNINKYLPISTYTYNLMYFLSNYFIEDDINKKNINLHYYISLYSIIKIIQYMYYKYPHEYNKSESFTNSCFNYSINFSKSKNYPDNYHYFLLNFKNLIQNNKNLDILPPKNYIGYPNCTIKNIFDKKKSNYYLDTQEDISSIGISNISSNYEF